MLAVAVLAPPVFTITVLLARKAITADSVAVSIPRSVLLLLALSTALALLASQVQHARQWKMPLTRLMQMLHLVRNGQAPIQELEQISGPLSTLRSDLQDILRELREHKAQLTQADRELRQRVAQHTEALQRAIGSLQTQANRDALTGLNNRRMLDQHLPEIIEQSRQGRSDLCLIMLDLDNFKCLNDTLGHRAGDDLLRTLGQIIRSSLRENDLAFRYGGDEFLIVLSGCDARAGRAMAQRLVALVDTLGKTLKTPRPLGLSAGVCTLNELSDPHLAELIETADRRLYAIKQARKNLKIASAA